MGGIKVNDRMEVLGIQDRPISDFMPPEYVWAVGSQKHIAIFYPAVLWDLPATPGASLAKTSPNIQQRISLLNLFQGIHETTG
jgi:hypothetical protein